MRPQGCMTNPKPGGAPYFAFAWDGVSGLPAVTVPEAPLGALGLVLAVSASMGVTALARRRASRSSEH
jgi:hypothetical protein